MSVANQLNPAVLQVTAQALADTVPDWAGRKFNPLLSWWQDGSDIVLLGSDGRKVRFNPDQIKQIATDDIEKKAAAVIADTNSALAYPPGQAGIGGLPTPPNAINGTVSHRVPVGEAGSPVPGTSQGEKPASSTRYSRVKRGRKPNPPASPPSPVLHGGQAGK
jgi:hypothetical protein